jgi:hypothetical protein
MEDFPMKTHPLPLMLASFVLAAPLSASFAKEIARPNAVDVNPRDAGGSTVDTSTTTQSATTRDPMAARTSDDGAVRDAPSDASAIGVGAIAIAFLIIIGFAVYAYRHRGRTA